MCAPMDVIGKQKQKHTHNMHVQSHVHHQHTFTHRHTPTPTHTYHPQPHPPTPLPVNKLCHFDKITLHKPPACECRSAHAHTARDQGRHIPWYCVFVGCNVCEFEYTLHSAAIHALGAKVHQQQVVDGACVCVGGGGECEVHV